MNIGENMTFYPYSDERLRFLGKWEEDGTGNLVSYSKVCFVKFVYRGTDLALQGSTDRPVAVFIDGEKYTVDFDGQIRIPAGESTHRVKIAMTDNARLSLTGVAVRELLSDCRLVATPYVKFIGDSITAAYPGFSSCCGELLDCDYSNDSVGGMSLCEGWGWPKDKDPLTGMETYYFKTGRSGSVANAGTYSFRYDRDPDAVVVFLGTNDYLDNEAEKAAGHVTYFAEHYAAFLDKLADRYPHAVFYILEPLSDKCCRQEGIEAGFARMKTALGDRVVLVPTHTWGVELSPDGTHPSLNGYSHMGAAMAAYLAEKL